MTQPPSPQQPEARQSTEASSAAGARSGCGETLTEQSASAQVRRGRPSLEEARQLPSRILDAAWQVLCQSGFEAFTFDRLARHARIGKATIYARFSGKRELLEALLARKLEERSLRIMAIGAGLPLQEAFCMRAAAIMDVLHSHEGQMMERLVDWCDQEFGDAEHSYRQAMYADAIENVSAELGVIARQQGLTISDPGLAARFWIEGVLGHVRMVGASRPPLPSETQAWARAYSDFFFAGLRNAASITDRAAPR